MAKNEIVADAPEGEISRDEDVLGCAAGLRHDLRTLGLLWLTSILLLATVTVLTQLIGGASGGRAHAAITILDLDRLAITPSGTAPRNPGGAHSAVIPAHVPGVAGAQVYGAADTQTPNMDGAAGSAAETSHR